MAAAVPLPPLQPLQFAEAADHLDDSVHLLHGLHRRHKNQHRVSTYWWPSFGQLRRAVARLVQDLRTASDKNGSQRIAGRVAETRALVPKVYLAFSRLVADKQFAPLGLLLIGVLAQVQTAVSGIEHILGVATDAADAADAADAVRAKTGSSSTDAPTTSASTSAPAGTGLQSTSRSRPPDADLGVAIARDAADTDARPRTMSLSRAKKRVRKDDGEKEVPHAVGIAAPTAATTAAKLTRKPDAEPHMDKKRSIGDKDEGRIVEEEEDELGEDRVEATKPAEATATATKEKDTKAKRAREKKDKDKGKDKKKKRKRGDEFDDLFSGLL